jgi:hypothetical protein
MGSFINGRQAIISLGVTLGVILAVVIAAFVFRGEPPATVLRSSLAKTQTPATSGSAETGVSTSVPTVQFEQIADPKFVSTPSNPADTFTITTGKGPQIFSLYFVEALSSDLTHQQRASEQAVFFGNTSVEGVLAEGRSAARLVEELLSTKPFRVLTRWERLPQTQRYLALILVELDNGQWTNLADLLVSRGYARIQGITTDLPDSGRAKEDYLVELNSLAQRAETDRLGIWSRVALAP